MRSLNLELSRTTFVQSVLLFISPAAGPKVVVPRPVKIETNLKTPARLYFCSDGKGTHEKGSSSTYRASFHNVIEHNFNPIHSMLLGVASHVHKIGCSELVKRGICS